MKYIEVSKKICIQDSVSPDMVKDSFIEKLRRVLDIEKEDGTLTRFTIHGTTGNLACLMRASRVVLSVDFRFENDVARILVSGHAQTAPSLVLTYVFLFTLVLLAGLLPGSIETSAESSGPADAMIFLIFGMFILYDVNKKLSEPSEMLESILCSLETEFG